MLLFELIFKLLWLFLDDMLRLRYENVFGIFLLLFTDIGLYLFKLLLLKWILLWWYDD